MKLVSITTIALCSVATVQAKRHRNLDSNRIKLLSNGDTAYCVQGKKWLKGNRGSVLMAECNDDEAQQWVYVPSDGQMQLRGTNLCWAYTKQRTDPEAKLQLVKCYAGAAAQSWNIDSHNRLRLADDDGTKCIQASESSISYDTCILNTWDTGKGKDEVMTTTVAVETTTSGWPDTDTAWVTSTDATDMTTTYEMTTDDMTSEEMTTMDMTTDDMITETTTTTTQEMTTTQAATTTTKEVIDSPAHGVFAKCKKKWPCGRYGKCADHPSLPNRWVCECNDGYYGFRCQFEGEEPTLPPTTTTTAASTTTTAAATTTSVGRSSTTTSTTMPDSSTTMTFTMTTEPSTSVDVTDMMTTQLDSTTMVDTTTSVPGTSMSIPGTSTNAPETTTGAPETSTTAPETSTTAPDTTTTAEETTTAAPETTTSVLETEATVTVTIPVVIDHADYGVYKKCRTGKSWPCGRKNECVAHPSLADRWVCKCADGYTGIRCETRIR